MLLTDILLISIFFFNQPEISNKPDSSFISPVKIPLLLSANFGELRVDHFHSGLDIKTQGVTGKEVVASESGYIYRISVSPGGFGNALYVSHPSGYSTVYGHLDRFTPDLEDYVKSQQYERKSFTITLFPPKGKFPVKQGELIGYSGNSGSSGGPHLHFEIRKAESEKPLNPLLFNFSIADNISPVIEKLTVYPVTRNTLINNMNSIKKINVSGGHGNYYIPSDNNITISGPAGFGIKTYDLLNDSYNRCAAYSIELKIDSNEVFKYVMDGFSFSESRYVNSHIDYETYQKENIYIERTFVLPNDRLSVYKDLVNRGIFNFADNKTHHIQIIVSDANNNRSSLTFRVKSEPVNHQAKSDTTDKNLKVMPYNRTNRFIADKIYVAIPAGALYDTLYFSYKKIPGTSEMLSDVHSVHNKFTPVQKAYNLSIKPTLIPKGKESKMLIVQIGDNQSKNAVSSSWSGEYLSAEVLSFGDFYIGLDTIPPAISPNGLTPGSDLSSKKEIRIKITDDLSGIKSWEPEIDGKWALFEYDQKNDLLTYKFDEKRITKGAKHNLSLKVTDNKNNSSYFNCDFLW
jgi:hypothetical protein